MTLEQEFKLLMATISRDQNPPAPHFVRKDYRAKLTHTRTVYSVGEALLQKEQKRHAELGGSSRRNPSA